MFKNFFVIALRNLRKQKFYAAINVLGLAVGLASCLLIVLFVQNEFNFDKYHTKADRTYRSYVDLKFGEMEGLLSYMPAPLGPQMIKDFPEVELMARLREGGTFLLKRTENDDNIKAKDGIYADADFFKIFDYKILEGDPVEGLKDPQTIVIAKTLADLHFKGESPIGKNLIIDNKKPHKVVAVFEDVTSNSEFEFDLFVSMEGSKESKGNQWVSHNFHTWVVLKEETNYKETEAKFPTMIEQHTGKQIQQYMKVDMDEFEAQGNRIKYFLQPLAETHLYSHDIQGMGGHGDIKKVKAFSIIAFCILLLACINFMNLSTARSALRAREVGVRKVLGSFRSHLIAQFLIESVLLTLFAFSVAVLLAELTIVPFNEMLSKSISIPFSSPSFWLLILGLALIVGLFAGLYPAFHLSSFQPNEVMKGKFSSQSKGKWVRSGLVVLQFAASVGLIISSLVVFRQINYLQTKELGYDKEQVMVLHQTWVLKKKADSFKEELLKLPEIQTASFSGYLPAGPSSNNNNIFWKKGDESKERNIIFSNWQVDHDYIEVMGMELASGRDFDIKLGSDSNAVVINEHAAKTFGFENPIGEQLSTFSDLDPETGEAMTRDYTIIGIVKDFHYHGMRNPIGSLGFFVDGYSRGRLSIRLKATYTKEVKMKIKEIWSNFAPGQPFEYSFLDDRFEKSFRAEERESKLYATGAILAILVACLGLFALSAFLAERRAKEIGVRKVLGASVTDILKLLSWDFTKLVMIGFAIGAVGAYFFASSWLEDFEYRNRIEWEVFVLAGIAAITISQLTISFQSIKAALSNPVEVLKDE